jgi:hypothetical protein
VAIQAAITAASTNSANCGRVYVPSGIYLTTGNFNLTNLTGLSIVGDGSKSSIFDITHATNDLFYWNENGASSGGANGQYFANFGVQSTTVTRTAGWVFHVDSTATVTNGGAYLVRSRIENIDVRQQYNGFWIAQYEFVWISQCILYNFVGTGGVGVKIGQTTTTNVNQGSGIDCYAVKIYGGLGGQPCTLSYGWWIEDTDAVYLNMCEAGGVVTNSLRVSSNGTGHNATNLFFTSSIFDSTYSGHTALFTAVNGGGYEQIKMENCWFCSSGRNSVTEGGDGLHIEAAYFSTSNIIGCTMYNNNKAGMKIITTRGAPVSIVGCQIKSNALLDTSGDNDNVYIDNPLNGVAPILSANYITGGGATGGKSIKTTNTTNRLIVIGNRILATTDYGIAPAVDEHNTT